LLKLYLATPTPAGTGMGFAEGMFEVYIPPPMLIAGCSGNGKIL
jgi:hypothetical protein